MALVSLAELRTQARNRCDMRVGSIFTDSDFNQAINSSIAELYDLQVKCWGDNYFLSSSIIPLSSDVSLYALPVAVTGSSISQGFYKLVGVDWSVGADRPWYSLKPYEFQDRNRFSNINLVSSATATNARYCLYGPNISILPAPQSGNHLRVWFIPQPPSLVNDSDTYDCQAGWQSYVIANTCILALAAEESDTTVFERQKAEIKERIMDMAPRRDVAEPHAVLDVESCWEDGLW